MNDDIIEAFLETDWLWSRSYEDYEPSPYDGTYGGGMTCMQRC